MSERIANTLKSYKTGKITIAKALSSLKELPYRDLGFAKVDHHRAMRRGFPEVIFGKGKTAAQTVKIAREIISHDGILLITRTSKEVYDRLKKSCPGIRFNEKAGIISYRKTPPLLKKGTVLIITAGTSDLPVAEEAKATLEIMGDRVEMLYDAGVAGIHRVLSNRKELDKADVIIVIAGMEGALASVVSGLVSKPVVAVPTSVGYGASFGGIAPLLAMMNSCSPGVAVVNIDNGFGAAYFASMINR
ncbi:MAG TPA: nickel pincer cofactor biosynthesis protein LarB [Candidatus Omnitrophota bacterium]|nr:nickel pincer cofactor biosynthesis protein LarB [Candidatus Omnitrophota bacterium]